MPHHAQMARLEAWAQRNLEKGLRQMQLPKKQNTGVAKKGKSTAFYPSSDEGSDKEPGPSRGDVTALGTTSNAPKPGRKASLTHAAGANISGQSTLATAPSAKNSLGPAAAMVSADRQAHLAASTQPTAKAAPTIAPPGKAAAASAAGTTKGAVSTAPASKVVFVPVRRAPSHMAFVGTQAQDSLKLHCKRSFSDPQLTAPEPTAKRQATAPAARPKQVNTTQAAAAAGAAAAAKGSADIVQAPGTAASPAAHSPSGAARTKAPPSRKPTVSAPQHQDQAPGQDRAASRHIPGSVKPEPHEDDEQPLPAAHLFGQQPTTKGNQDHMERQGPGPQRQYIKRTQSAAAPVHLSAQPGTRKLTTPFQVQAQLLFSRHSDSLKQEQLEEADAGLSGDGAVVTAGPMGSQPNRTQEGMVGGPKQPGVASGQVVQRSASAAAAGALLAAQGAVAATAGATAGTGLQPQSTAAGLEHRHLEDPPLQAVPSSTLALMNTAQLRVAHSSTATWPPACISDAALPGTSGRVDGVFKVCCKHALNQCC